MVSNKFKMTACAAVLAALSLNAQAQISGGSVKIGVLTDLSGTYSDLAGSGAVLATRMAIDDFMANEKPNFKIEMVTADHQNKADIASNKAREWLERENVDTVTELVTTSTALAVMKVAKEKDRLVIMNGPAGISVSDDRRAGATPVLAAHPDVKVLTETNTAYNATPAQEAMTSLLFQYPEIDGILSLGGALTAGAILAMDKQGRDMVPMTGENYRLFLELWKEKGLTAWATMQPGPRSCSRPKS